MSPNQKKPDHASYIWLLLYNECSTMENNSERDCTRSKLVPTRKQMFQVKPVILIGQKTFKSIASHGILADHTIPVP